jgi:hypothetical protein
MLLMSCSQITSDGSGFGAAWHLDQVEVFDTSRAVSTVFPCGEWLDPKDPMTLQQVGGHQFAVQVWCRTSQLMSMQSNEGSGTIHPS